MPDIITCKLGGEYAILKKILTPTPLVILCKVLTPPHKQTIIQLSEYLYIY